MEPQMGSTVGRLQSRRTWIVIVAIVVFLAIVVVRLFLRHNRSTDDIPWIEIDSTTVPFTTTAAISPLSSLRQ
jgi:hypothetical protein